MSFSKQLVIDAKQLKFRFELKNISQYFNGGINSENVLFGKGKWYLSIKMLSEENTFDISLQDGNFTKGVSCTMKLLGLKDELIKFKVFPGSSSVYEPFRWKSIMPRSEFMKKISPNYYFTIACEMQEIEPKKVVEEAPIKFEFPAEMRQICSSEFHDMRIEVEGKTIHAHRFLLSTYSKVLHQAIQDLESLSAPLKVDSFSYDCIQEVVNFIYGRELKLTENNAISILLAASRFQIVSLEKRCERFIFEKLVVDNAFETLVFAKINLNAFLFSETLKFMMKNIKELSKKTEKWNEFANNRPEIFKYFFQYIIRNNILQFKESESTGEPLNSSATSILNNDYQKLFVTKAFSDVVFEVDGEVIKAHKCILTCRSSFFQTLFTHEETVEAKENIIRITDFDFKTMELFLSYIYSGKILNLEKNAMNLYRVADKYNVEDLKIACSNYIQKSITADNITEVLKLADLYSDLRILKTATLFIQKNHKDVFDTVKWSYFASKNSGILSGMLIRHLESDNK